MLFDIWEHAYKEVLHELYTRVWNTHFDFESYDISYSDFSKFIYEHSSKIISDVA